MIHEKVADSVSDIILVLHADLKDSKNLKKFIFSATCSSGNPLFFRNAFNRSLRLKASSSKLPSTAAILNLNVAKTYGSNKKAHGKYLEKPKWRTIWLLKTLQISKQFARSVIILKLFKYHPWEYIKWLLVILLAW